MNLIAHIAGFLGLVWMVQRSFLEYDEPLIGWALVVLSLLLFIRMMMAAVNDWLRPFSRDD